VARPRKAIDGDMVRKLAAIDCTIAEIAATLECSRDTLERRFRDAIEQGREQGKASLRRKQWELAMGGNPTMLIFHGKQRLGQADKTEMRAADGGILIRVVREPQTLHRAHD
jgi:hypothetical protein